MTKAEPWFLGDRAVLLAKVALTRLPGVTVHSTAEEVGIDLLITLPAQRGGRVFGVQVKAARTREAEITPDGTLRPDLVEQLQRSAGDSPFPLGIVIFDMSNDAGYFGWLLAPTVSATGEPLLEHEDQIVVVPLTTDELRRVLADVDHWYDARLASVAQQGA